jgi:predicted DNA-binding transcriptional regulator AlpA
VALWQIYGPDEEYLFKPDVCRFLRLTEQTLDRLIRESKFPRGHKSSPQSEPLWHAADIASYLHLARLLEPEPEPKKKPENPTEKNS